MSIVWPKDWGQKEGWPVTRSDQRAVTDRRTWRDLNATLVRRHNVKTVDLIESLGGVPLHKVRFEAELDEILRRAHEYYTLTGMRPTSTCEVRFFRQANNQLYRLNSSLKEFLDSQGFPQTPTWNLRKIQEIVLKQFRKTGKRPIPSKNRPLFVGIEAWLQTNEKTSLSALCDRLRLPKTDRSVSAAKRSILAFYKQYRKSPRYGDLADKGIESWLRRRGTSLSKLCNQLGLPR